MIWKVSTKFDSSLMTSKSKSRYTILRSTLSPLKQIPVFSDLSLSTCNDQGWRQHTCLEVNKHGTEIKVSFPFMLCSRIASICKPGAVCQNSGFGFWKLKTLVLSSCFLHRVTASVKALNMCHILVPIRLVRCLQQNFCSKSQQHTDVKFADVH